MLVVRLGHPVAGLVLLRLPRLDTEAIAKKVAAMMRENAEGLGGYVTSFSERRIRRRSLPETRV